MDQKCHFLVTYSETLPNQKHCQNQSVINTILGQESPTRNGKSIQWAKKVRPEMANPTYQRKGEIWSTIDQKHCQILSFQTILDPENVPEFRPYYNFSVPELAVYYHFLDPKTANSPANYCISKQEITQLSLSSTCYTY